MRESRKAYLIIIVSVVLLIALAIFGLPLSAKLATFFSDLKTGNKTVQIKDTTPPGPPHLNNLPEATNQQKLEVSGTCEPQATVILSVNEKEENVKADSDGNFVFQISLEKNENKIWAKVKDSAGNESQPSSTYSVTYDNESPKLDISSPKDGASFYGTKQRLVNLVGSTKLNSTVTVSDRMVRLNDDGSFTFTYNLSPGDNTLNIKVVDQAGNTTEKNLTLHYSE